MRPSRIMLVPMELQFLERSEPTPKSLMPIALRELDQKHQSAFFSGKPAMIMPLSRVKVGNKPERLLEEEEDLIMIGISAPSATAAAAAAC